MSDPYDKLRPIGPTPPDEICDCDTVQPLILYRSFGANPLHCLACHREVPPERIGFPEGLASSLGAWRDFYAAFDTLWLDSGSFEDWARHHLADPTGPVVVRGREVVAQLNGFRRAYLLWFQDVSAEGYEVPTLARIVGPLWSTRGEP